jgi:dihydroxyacetone kinase
MDKLTIKDVVFIIDKMAEVIVRNEIYFCELDSAAGDGDFGMSLAKGFRQLKKDWNTLDTDNIGGFLKSCGMVIMEYCGGASGPIWGSAFRGAAKQAGEAEELDTAGLGAILQAAVAAIQKTGERSFGRGAVVGDKTLIDALAPCADSVTASGKAGINILTAMQKGAEAAVAGAESTKRIAARMGRAASLGERSMGYPDAGAFALGIIFTEIVDALKERVL